MEESDVVASLLGFELGAACRTIEGILHCSTLNNQDPSSSVMYSSIQVIISDAELPSSLCFSRSQTLIHYFLAKHTRETAIF
jgi:hypothetical protein